ncbi:Restriction endonuclease [compost metagenome]
MKKGLEYELLVERIYKELSNGEIIKQNDSLEGHDSGGFRQIDLSIRSRITNTDLLIIVQAKDLTRKADIKVLDEFRSVIKDVRANKGILVCAMGFTKKAIEYAKKQSIDLYSAHTPTNKKWAFGLEIPALKAENLFQVNFAPMLPVTPGEKVNVNSNIKFRNSNGAIPLEKMMELAFKGIQLDMSGKWNTFDVIMEDLFCDQINSEFRKVEDLRIEYRFRKRTVFTNVLVPSEYRILVDHIKEDITPSFVGFDEVMALLTDYTNWKALNNGFFDRSKPHLEVTSTLFNAQETNWVAKFYYKFNKIGNQI